MKIKVRIASALREFVTDAEIADSGRGEIEVDVGATPADVIRLMNIPENHRLMVILDGTMVTRPELAKVKLQESQTISLNPPIQAG